VTTGFIVIATLGHVSVLLGGAVIVGLGGGCLNSVVGLTFIESTRDAERGRVLGAENALLTLFPGAGIALAAVLIEFASLQDRHGRAHRDVGRRGDRSRCRAGPAAASEPPDAGAESGSVSREPPDPDALGRVAAVVRQPASRPHRSSASTTSLGSVTAGEDTGASTDAKVPPPTRA
jgi:hypothetical protein